MPELPILLSIFALLVSLISLGFSAHFGLRDRFNLVTECKFFPDDEHGPAQIQLSIVNAGRRIAVLKYFGGDYFDGGGAGLMIGEDTSGLQLNEQEMYERRFDWDALHQMHDGGNVKTYENFWVEDTLGRRHIIKGSRKSIKKLLESGKDNIL